MYIFYQFFCHIFQPTTFIGNYNWCRNYVVWRPIWVSWDAFIPIRCFAYKSSRKWGTTYVSRFEYKHWQLWFLSTQSRELWRSRRPCKWSTSVPAVSVACHVKREWIIYELWISIVDYNFIIHSFNWRGNYWYLYRENKISPWKLLLWSYGRTWS